MSLGAELLEYHSPGNRYAYYPTTKNWKGKGHEGPREIPKRKALYLHLPFCQELCTFCGCNIRLSQRSQEHIDYVETLKKEWSLLASHPQWKEVLQSYQNHPLENLILGGGTPSQLQPQAQIVLQDFLKGLFPKGIKDGHTEASPRSFNSEFYNWAKELGIKSYSFGVQDFDPNILQNVNRKQNPKDLKKALALLSHEDRRGIDLIWGLPHQTLQVISSWRDHLEELDLDWVSFYPLAKVPWLATYQNALGDFTLPLREEKYELYAQGAELLKELGYHHFGFGHFIHSQGRLYNAFKEGSLYRSVSGLFEKPFESLLGLGVGAISQFPDYLGQNQKIYERYLHTVNQKECLPRHKDHLLSEKEESFHQIIDELMGHTPLSEELMAIFHHRERLEWFNEQRALSEKGRHFLKNILQRIEKHHFGPT